MCEQSRKQKLKKLLQKLCYSLFFCAHFGKQIHKEFLPYIGNQKAVVEFWNNKRERIQNFTHFLKKFSILQIQTNFSLEKKGWLSKSIFMPGVFFGFCIFTYIYLPMMHKRRSIITFCKRFGLACTQMHVHHVPELCVCTCLFCWQSFFTL